MPYYGVYCTRHEEAVMEYVMNCRIYIYVVYPESNENGFQKNIFIENFYKLM
jgi:presenilin-like A22 family membrane protease